MAKPSSGHFSGTTGSKNAYKNLSRNIDRYAIILPRDLDLREHPDKRGIQTKRVAASFNSSS